MCTPFNTHTYKGVSWKVGFSELQYKVKEGKLYGHYSSNYDNGGDILTEEIKLKIIHV